MSDNAFYTEIEDDDAKQKITNHLQHSLDIYHWLIKQGFSLEQAAKVLPLGMGVSVTVSGNLRCWMEYLSKRLCKRASQEHQALAKEIYATLHGQYPEFINLNMLGICEGCKESSCDFTVHKRSPKTPIRAEFSE